MMRDRVEEIALQNSEMLDVCLVGKYILKRTYKLQPGRGL
jgi:hypothetical protein